MLTSSQLQDLLQPGAEALGFEIIAVEWTARGDASLLRIYIDGPDGVTVDDCAMVSRQISAILDVEDPISDVYTLEVSSPGMDRPLTKAQHFAAVLDQRVKLKTFTAINGRRRFNGVLSKVSEHGVVLVVDGVSWEIPFDQIEKARLVPDYGQTMNHAQA